MSFGFKTIIFGRNVGIIRVVTVGRTRSTNSRNRGNIYFAKKEHFVPTVNFKLENGGSESG
jgi:hypothetical protein